MVVRKPQQLSQLYVFYKTESISLTVSLDHLIQWLVQMCNVGDYPLYRGERDVGISKVSLHCRRSYI